MFCRPGETNNNMTRTIAKQAPLPHIVCTVRYAKFYKTKNHTKSRSMKPKILLVTFLFATTSLITAQKLDNNLQIEDVKDALEMAGFNIFKYDFGNIEPGHLLTVYIEELIHDTVFNSKEFRFMTVKEGSGKENIMKIIARQNDYKSESFIVKFLFPTMMNQSPVEIHEDYRSEHIWKAFEEGEVVYEEKIPILMYGSMWEDELPSGMKIKRFCWGTTLKRDMSNEELDSIEHMFVISYKLTKM